MDELQVFVVYYAGLMSLRLHPANTDVDFEAEILACADIASRMVEETRKRYGVELCRGS